MKESNPAIQEIKLKIDPEVIKQSGTLEEIRWENDGGKVSDISQIFDDSSLPLKPGDVFKVHDGHISEEDGSVFFCAKVELLPKK